MAKELYSYLEKVPDSRRAEGLRFPLASVLTMSIMSSMCGYSGFRSGATFMQSNKADLVSLFNLKHGVPGSTQYGTILKGINYDDLADAFYQWSSQYVTVSDAEWFQIDGKSLRSTLKNSSNSKQRYEALVSLFCTKLGISFNSVAFENGESSEITAVQTLLKSLKEKGIVLTLDALHCQKKQLS